MRRFFIASFVLFFVFFSNLEAQKPDWRKADNGSQINENGYCDQPYVVVLPSGKWLCVFTTNEGEEGSKGQYIVSCTSSDQGKSWSKPVKIEKPGDESKSWAMPYLTDYGRVYVFYSYNGDKIHELRGKKIREDIIGWYCYKYTEDEGKTWSKRYRLDVRETAVDRNNDWEGKVQIFWGIGKPVDFEEGMMFAFTKVGKFMLDDSEGWFFRCDNINSEKDCNKLEWKMLPDGEYGLKNEKLGLINSEQNIFILDNGTIYCMHRTISGHPAESYSYDGGKTWTLPQVPKYINGTELKTPRACPRIWKATNGKYLFWYHNNGGWNFDTRNPAWISGGIEKDGKIVWSQPEILIYDSPRNIRMSYPDLIEQDGKYWITETNKTNARCHEIPTDFFNMIWNQFETDTITEKNLVAEWNSNQLKPENIIKNSDNLGSFEDGFTFDLQIQLGDLKAGQVLFEAYDNDNRSVKLQTADYGSIEIILNDGNVVSKWNSDPGLISTFDSHRVAVTVDNGPKIIQFIIDGNVSTGRNFRKFGWGYFDTNMTDFSFDNIKIGKMSIGHFRPAGQIEKMNLYNRALFNSEVIANHRCTID